MVVFERNFIFNQFKLKLSPFVFGYLTHLWVVTSNFVVLHNDNDVLEEESITF